VGESSNTDGQVQINSVQCSLRWEPSANKPNKTTTYG